jgi:hypothetical protein
MNVTKFRQILLIGLTSVLILSQTSSASANLFGESTCSKLDKKLSQLKYQKALKTSPAKRTREDWGYAITYAVAEVNYPSCFTSASLAGAKAFLRQVLIACNADMQFSSACIYRPFGKQFFPISTL